MDSDWRSINQEVLTEERRPELAEGVSCSRLQANRTNLIQAGLLYGRKCGFWSLWKGSCLHNITCNGDGGALVYIN